MPLQSADFLEAAFGEPVLVASLRLLLQVAKTVGDRTVTEDPPKGRCYALGEDTVVKSQLLANSLGSIYRKTFTGLQIVPSNDVWSRETTGAFPQKLGF